MRNIKISCVIPTCDRNNLLIETLNSVLSQTSLPDEIIIVNNGDQKLDLPLNKNVNIKIYNIIKYVGVAQALNFGVNISKGNYIAFLEDDDLWEQNYIKNIRESIETNYSVYVSRIDKLQKNKIIKYKNAINKINVNNFLTHNPGVNISNLCVKKEALINIKGFDPRIKVGADRSVVIDLLLANYKFKVLEHNQEIARFHDDIRLSRNYKNMINSQISFYFKYRKIMNFYQKLTLLYKIVFLFVFKKT